MSPPQEDTCASCQCGPNSVFQTVNDKPSCACLPDFIGSPPNCRPECVSNSECSSNMACINRKCRDPCPGSCGSNAECRVVSHTPMCACLSGFTGDPFTQCIPKPRKIYKLLRETWKSYVTAKTLGLPRSNFCERPLVESSNEFFSPCE